MSKSFTKQQYHWNRTIVWLTKKIDTELHFLRDDQPVGQRKANSREILRPTPSFIHNGCPVSILQSAVRIV